MISWILFIILITWCLYKRFSKDIKVEGQPLGMPRGTIRALITIMIVAFPFNYIFFGEQIPGLITNAIFILIAFYFQSRKSRKDRLKQIIKEIKNPEKAQEKEIQPLYLPKFSVRFVLLILIALIVIGTIINPDVTFETTNTMADLLVIISLFFIGAFLKGFGSAKEKKRVHQQIMNIDHQNLSKYEIIEKVMDQTPSWWKQKGKNLLSLIILCAVIVALACYTINVDYIILSLPFYVISLRGSLLLLINVYYGFRD